MNNKTEAYFEKQLPRHETELEIEITLTAKGPGTGRSTIISTINTMLENRGFVTRVHDELMPGYRVKLEGRRKGYLVAFPPEECSLCGRKTNER